LEVDQQRQRLEAELEAVVPRPLAYRLQRAEQPRPPGDGAHLRLHQERAAGRGAALGKAGHALPVHPVAVDDQQARRLLGGPAQLGDHLGFAQLGLRRKGWHVAERHPLLDQQVSAPHFLRVAGRKLGMEAVPAMIAGEGDRRLGGRDQEAGGAGHVVVDR